MKKSEMAMLLVFVHSVQGGGPNDLEVEAWHEIVGGLSYQDASEAARKHFREESRRLWPADLIARREGFYRPPAPEGKRYAVDVASGVPL